MKLSEPKVITFLVAIVIAVIAVLGLLLGFLAGNLAFWVLLVGFVLLALANLLNGL
jgi:hypothetical protein